MHAGDADAIRCNLSSWYVEPAFRAYATLLVAQALRHKDVTYLNVSAAPHTWPIIEAQGFSRYCDGVFIAMPMLNLSSGAAVKIFDARREPAVDFDPADREVLLEHAEHGCISLWCATAVRAYPFVFRRRLVRNFLPCAQMIYCSDVADFVRFAGPIGRYLALRGRFFAIIDANGPIPGLVGMYRRGSMPKYFKGPQRPRLGDLAYTEYAILGVSIASALRAAAGQFGRSRPCVANNASANRSMPKAMQPVCATSPASVHRFHVAPKWSR